MNKAIVISLILLGTLCSHAATVEIKMLNNGKDGIMTFEPGFVSAQPGDTVVFVPTDPAHSVASFLVPDGAKTFTGKMNEKVTVKLEKEGVYIVKCEPHLPMAMVAVIQVGKAGNLAAAKEKADGLSKGFAMNKDRLAKYMGQIK